MGFCFLCTFGLTHRLILIDTHRSLPTGTGAIVLLSLLACGLGVVAVVPPQRPTKKTCQCRHSDWQKKFVRADMEPPREACLPPSSLFHLSPPLLLTLFFTLPPHSLPPPLLNPPTSLTPPTPRQTLPVTAQLSQAQLGHNPQYKPHIPNKETNKKNSTAFCPRKFKHVSYLP